MTFSSARDHEGLILRFSGIDGVLASIPKREPRYSTSVLAQVLALDDDGLPETTFQEIMIRCGCGLIMTKRVFHAHRCMVPVKHAPAHDTEVIDLTTEN